MAVTRDWIPKQIHKFKIFADNLCKRVRDNAEAWHLDAEEVSKLLSLRLKFNKYYKISTVQYTHNLNDIENTKKARKEYQKALRTMGICQLKSNLFMNDSDRMKCGLNTGEKGYNLSPVASYSPLIDFRSAGDLGGTIISMDPASHKACKPVGQNGIRVRFGFYPANEPITLEADCTQTIGLTKSFGKVVFDPTKKGMRFVGYARYFNTRQIEGIIATTFYGIVC